MGYEIPAAIGTRLADADPAHRVTAFIGDGTFLMAPTELATAAQEGLPITVVVPENHGYQVIHRLQMFTMGREFGNEFRYRTDAAHPREPARTPRLTGDYLQVDLVQVAAGLGARAVRATTRRRDPARRCGRPGRETRPVVHRRPGHPACRPAVRGLLVGRRPRRGVRVRHGRARPAAEYEAGLADPAVARMTRTRYALDRGELRRRLARGEVTYGTFLGAATPVTAEVCAAAGVDWVLLDLEHGGGGEEQAGDVIPAAASYSVPTVVRVESTERIRAGRLLDLGAAGVMFPRIDTRRRSGRLRPPPALPAGRGPGRGHLQPDVPVRARPRLRSTAPTATSSAIVQIETRPRAGRRRGHRGRRRRRRAVRRPPRPQPRPRGPRPDPGAGVPRRPRAGPGRGEGEREGGRPARAGRRRGRQDVRAPAGSSSPSGPTRPCSPAPSPPSCAEPVRRRDDRHRRAGGGGPGRRGARPRRRAPATGGAVRRRPWPRRTSTRPPERSCGPTRSSTPLCSTGCPT